MDEGQKSTRLNGPCILLIVIAGIERFAFKGVASNLVTYLTDVLNMTNSSAAKTVNSWVGVTFLLPLLVAPLADNYWDRYTTILVSSVLYALGLLALTSTTLQSSWTPMKIIRSISSLSWSLYMISLGISGYNSSLQAFGADQLENEDELPTNKTHQGSGKKSAFFQWWYFGICCGSLLGASIMSYIQDNVGWGLGFAIPTIAVVASIVVFSCGNRFYTHKQARNSETKSFEVVQKIKSAFCKLVKRGKGLPKDEYGMVELELQEKEALVAQDCNDVEGLEEHQKDYARPVQAIKIILRLLPLWVMLLMFAVIFQQPATFFTKQGMTMKRNIGSKFKIPPAALQSAITVSIVILTPLYDKVFIPAARVILRNEKGVTVMQRMGIGMFLSVIAMVIAAITERKRLEISKSMGNSEAKTGDVPFSIFWLLPQYILLGISDIFTVVGMQEFFYNEVPAEMKTMGIALCTSVFGVGSFLSAFLITTIEYLTSSGGRNPSWFSDDMNEARLDNYYWFLTISSSVSLVTFVLFCKFYRAQEHDLAQS